MPWVYILRNPITKRYYVGSTIDLKRRLRQHRSGNTRTSRILGTRELVYKAEYATTEAARLREKKLSHIRVKSI